MSSTTRATVIGPQVLNQLWGPDTDPNSVIGHQFLSEAVMLTALCGLVGSVFAVGLCLLGAAVIPKLWPPDPSSLTQRRFRCSACRRC
jgi:hypothetical protein